MLEAAAIRVLMVEDSPISQHVANNIFKKLNCQMTMVSMATKGFEEYILSDFDIIFVDIMLPDVDGFILVDALRQLIKNKNNIPLIAITALTTEDAMDKASAAGFNDFMRKPLTIDSVTAIFQKYLSPDKIKLVGS